MSDTGQGMAGAGGAPFREVKLAKPSRPHRSGSPSEGSWIAPPEPDKPVTKRPAFIASAVLMAALIVLLVTLLVL